MMFISLFSSEQGFVASDQRVFSAEELSPLDSVLEQSQLLSEQLAQQSDNEQKALEDARLHGYADGTASGLAQATSELAQKIEALHEQHQKATEALRVNAADIAVEIVRKIAGEINSADWLTALAQRAAEDLIDQPILTLRVHTTQADALKASVGNLSGTRIQKVVADDFVPIDGCVLETAEGQINVDLETQLGNVLALLRIDDSAHDSASE